MSAPVVIGLIGKKRSGKDSFAATLVEEHGYKRVAFADPLRDAALRLDPYVDGSVLDNGELHPYRLSEVVQTLGWERAKDEVPEVRRILQALGTDAIRTIDADFWVRSGVAAIQAELGAPSEASVVVTDVRFPNEADAIRDSGGILVRIVRPGYDGDGHATETALDDYVPDILVNNDGTLDQLGDAALAVATNATTLRALRDN